MALDDVWRTFHRDLDIAWKGHFDELPQCPGVYAWFYPLRVTSYSLEQFLADVRRVHLYDAKSGSEPRMKASMRIGWSLFCWTGHLQNPSEELTPQWEVAWNQLLQDPQAFDQLRRVLLTASLLMPPLYVGKTVDIRKRCHQHLAGATGFATRFKKRSSELELAARGVDDLLFVAVRTEAISDSAEHVEQLIEAVLKLVGRPPYGIV